ncbi:glycosyltransferase family 4 protein [Dyella jiangningensis]|uniref:Glycosyl transferase family 1 n=1 Tax=Dyella jiangningensis TaxID=1379159 RepID=A0A328P401_9GAMM|nr:glycosyltransferase family 4 protein [Dyella jiangningensis]RAO76978.1 glycosyl transferase family 1 [Dyella jiangningensis]
MTDISTCLVGHPFAPIGRGEDVRCTFRALRSVAVRPGVLDLYRINRPDSDVLEELQPFLTTSPGKLNIFHLNGDEIEQALETLGDRLPNDSYNIIYPAWELSQYPSAWAEQLNRVDEIWAPTQFIFDALRPVINKPLIRMPLACEVVLSSFRSRRYFGIPESSYAFLFFFDFRSYAARKNPGAVIKAFELLRRQRPTADVCLVIKTHGSHAAPQALAALIEAITPLRDRVVLVDQAMTDNDTKNLVHCCDAFVSLHRSEGFGRGLAEAMYLGKPVIATAYSGNLDFMDSDCAYLVDYNLVPVKPGEYPHAENQVWADANVEQAAGHMVTLADSPDQGRQLGRRASQKVRDSVGHRATGIRYRDRLDELHSIIASWQPV